MKATDVLKAGGIAPLGAKVEGDVRAGPVSARAFTHAALPGETIVRLVPDVLAPGVDVEMDTLGFARAPDHDREKLGQQRFRALGFPGWPLVHDPARAKFALEVMKSFKKAAAQARSKPGNARDGFVEIGDRLARSVPHFLPSFWEEAGRVFIAEDSTTFAAQSFEKARQAEKEHNLEIDEDARSAVYLEFALAGAVAAKSLAGYAKELADAYGAAKAWPRYRELAVRRVLGGMPPWSGMAKELRGLAKAAKLDLDAEDDAFIAEVLEAPALVRAPGELWTSYRNALVRLGKSKPAVRKRLRHLFPKPSSGANGFPLQWLELLVESGALEGLLASTGEDSEEPGGAAEWLNKALSFVDGAPAMLPIVKKLAPRIVADGKPFQAAFGSQWRSRIDLDVTELALELSIPIAEPSNGASIDLAKPFSCDPVRVANDARFAPFMLNAVEAVLGTAPFEEAARGKEGLRIARGAWVRREVSRLSGAGLPMVASSTQRLREKATPALWQDFPDALEALKKADVAEALARSLRIGLFAELTWPAWEELVEKIGAAFTVGGAWPNPVLYTAAKAWVLGPKGVLLEHDFVLPPKIAPQGLLYVDGDLLVSFWSSEGARAYWASSAQDPFATESYLRWYGDDLPTSIACAGGVTLGSRVIQRGDRKLPDITAFCTDGANYWTGQWDDGRWKLRELDPVTGQQGRFSWPKVAEAAAALDDGLRILGVALAPAPEEAMESPLGQKDGLLGWVMRGVDHYAAGKAEIVGIDGRRWETNRGRRALPSGLLRMPADDAVRVVTTSSEWTSTGRIQSQHLSDAEGVHGCAVRPQGYGGKGWTQIPPVSLWHFLRPRDLPASKALRAIDGKTARVLLDAAIVDHKAEDKTGSKTRVAIGQALPAVTAKPLVDAIVAAALEGAERVARVAEVTDLAGRASVTDGGDKIADASLSEALGPFGGNTWGGGVLSSEVETASAYFQEKEPGEFQGSQYAWPSWIGALRGLAVFGSLAGREAADRKALSRALLMFARTIFAEKGRVFRRFTVHVAGDSPIRHATSNIWCGRSDASRYFFRTSHSDNVWHGTAIEHSSDGTFRVPPGVTIEHEERVEITIDERAWLKGWAEASSATPPWDAAAYEKLASLIGVTRAEAALILAGLPKVNVYAADFLGKELRERLGLKTTDAKVARESLRSLAFAKVMRAFTLAAPDDPKDLFRPYAETDFIERLGRAWNEVFGARVSLREELVVECEKDLDLPLPAATVLAALVDPASSTMLKPKKLEFEQLFAWNDKTTTELRANGCVSLAMLLPWLLHELPVGDDYRDAVPRLHEAILASLADPELVLPLNWFYASDETQKATLRKLIESFGGEELQFKMQHRATELARDNGALIGAILGNGFQGHIAFRPGRGDCAQAFKLARDTTFNQNTFGAGTAVELLRSPGLAAMIARARQTPVPKGGYEANPAASCAALVAEVAKKLKLSAESAAHYLQLLALAEPTSKSVQLWNDWKPATYKKTCAELLEKKLVVEGKRERAGREVFLPGAWDKASKGKNLPTEAWKSSFYASGLLRTLPTRPHHELFEAAWKRVQSGDVPKFEEV